jgi:hypothetical protein
MNAAMLRDFGSQMPPAERQQVETAMAELRANVGEIDVLTALGGGMVVIDGQQRGTTPLPAAILVDAGTHSVRVSKEGYETFEAEVRVAARQRRSVQAALQALRKGGTLIVKEAEGRALDVIVDGAVVGRTPWQGTVGVGRHHVSLGGKGELGTPPSAADVREGQTTTLALQAAALDAELRIEPSPSSAQVDVDGVNVGAGIWQGRLASGEHRIEIYAAGHVPDRRNVVLTQSRQELRVTLERDLSNPMWKIGFLPHLYLEATVAGAFAPSFGGSADARCDQGDCSHRSRPLGVLAGARAGYRLNGGLGLELFAGYAYLKETVTRRAGATWDSTTDLVSTDYRDSTTLSGPLAALSASYQVLERTPLTFRIWLGMARARARSTNRGTFSGPVGSGFDTQEVSIPETPADLWLPMVGPEVRFGYRLRRRWLIDVGLAVLWAFPPDIERVGGLGLVGVESRVAAPVSGRSLQLEREKSLGTFVTFFPSAAVSFDL